jgi:hypothetical protein
MKVGQALHPRVVRICNLDKHLKVVGIRVSKFVLHPMYEALPPVSLHFGKKLRNTLIASFLRIFFVSGLC